MARASRNVIWHGDDLLKEVAKLQIEVIDKVALEILVESKPPIDTGYLDASAYVNSSSGLNTFDETWQTGHYLSRNSGRMEWRDSVDSPEPPPKDGAVAGWAADYAIYVEADTNFIYEALQTVAAKHNVRIGV